MPESGILPVPKAKLIASEAFPEKRRQGSELDDLSARKACWSQSHVQRFDLLHDAVAHAGFEVADIHFRRHGQFREHGIEHART